MAQRLTLSDKVGERHIVRRGNRFVFAGFVNLDGLAVEFRVGEMVGRLAEVDEGAAIPARTLCF